MCFTCSTQKLSGLFHFSSPIKQALEKQKKQFKQEWLNTPNVYRKEEIEEIGTPNPKKITKVTTGVAVMQTVTETECWNVADEPVHGIGRPENGYDRSYPHGQNIVDNKITILI